MKLSKMNTNQLRDLAVELGADRRTLYGTSKQALIIKIHRLQDEIEQQDMAEAADWCYSEADVELPNILN